LFHHFPHLNFVVLHGTRDRRLKLLKEKADIYIVNHDGVEIIAEALEKRTDIDTILVDELAVFRNASTSRWKTLNRICNGQIPRRVWGFTGTPIPNEPTDAWAQARLIDPTNPTVPKYFSRFRDSVMRQVSQYKWVPRDNALEVVKEVLNPQVRFSLEDCTDLPPQVLETRDVELTPEQKKAYDEMLKKLHFEYAAGEVTAANEAVKAGKLIQIVCGVAYGSAGENIIIPAQPRLNALKEIIEESEGKVIVFVPLTGALNRVADFVSEFRDVATVDGGTPKRQRDETFKTFQHEKDLQVIVAQPGCMSHGLTLTAATTIVWFGPIYSNEIYTQANARVRRPGQKRSTVIVHLMSTEVERRIYEKLRSRGRTQGLLLGMLKGDVSK
jgi:SNF2 family DNA or RNA helicase